ncbi:hypothetical protein QZH41_019230, partial [Actinostola sp. cb2023]
GDGRFFNGHIKQSEYNRKWWELRTRYQGIKPPISRDETNFDPGAKYHIPANIAYIRTLMMVRCYNEWYSIFTKHLSISWIHRSSSSVFYFRFQEGRGHNQWALKSTTKKVRFSEKQKTFLDCKYNVGEQTGKKTNGEEVAREMSRARGKDGKRLFTIEDFLSSHQIASYLSRVTAKRRNLTVLECQAQEQLEVLREVTQ